ncbi:uncharacterized protein LOC143911316 [Arctopsyche grandis]|uniref:uncharacterized protein LOC143911316 n=1 Tax=Arctopsyche grandis TaxID=121162 RepID=UPI00406D6C91
MVAKGLKISKYGYLVTSRKLVQWNQILPGIIFLMCFMTIFPVVQANTVLENQKTVANNCSTTVTSHNEYHVDCDGININVLTAMIEVEVLKFPNWSGIIDRLFILNLITEDGKLSHNWINTEKFHINELFIEMPDTNVIENNAFNGFAFEEVIDLHLINMKIDNIEEGTFEGLHSLKRLVMVSCELNHINENALQGVAPNLTSMSLISMTLPISPTNLTGTVHLPKLTEIIMILNNIGSLDAGSFSQVEKVKKLRLFSNKIKHIGCGTFEKTTALKWLELDDNLLTTLDHCIFSDKVLTGIESLFIEKNQWNCNCDLGWLKDLKNEHIIFDNPACTIPFEKFTFCNKKVKTIPIID